MYFEYSGGVPRVQRRCTENTTAVYWEYISSVWRIEEFSSVSEYNYNIFCTFAPNIHLTNTPYAMPHRERLNNANGAKRVTDSFGHSNIFATLSQLLTANYTLLNIAGVRAIIIYGFSCKLARRSDCFLPIHLWPSTADNDNNNNNKLNDNKYEKKD